MTRGGLLNPEKIIAADQREWRASIFDQLDAIAKMHPEEAAKCAEIASGLRNGKWLALPVEKR